MIVVIDNFDSFTFNIVDFYRGLGEEVSVFRNNEITVKDIEALQPTLIVLSPGPKDPNAAGITLEAIQYFAGKIPLFGVCLGCQSIAQVYGAKIIRANKMYHGKTSLVTHNEQGVLHGVCSPAEEMRYHSLIVDESTMPDCLEITARSESNEIMAIRHKQFPIEGVQFHPESIASTQGDIIMQNALFMKTNTSQGMPRLKRTDFSKNDNVPPQEKELEKSPEKVPETISEEIQEKIQALIEQLLEKKTYFKTASNRNDGVV